MYAKCVQHKVVLLIFQCSRKLSQVALLRPRRRREAASRLRLSVKIVVTLRPRTLVLREADVQQTHRGPAQRRVVFLQNG